MNKKEMINIIYELNDRLSKVEKALDYRDYRKKKQNAYIYKFDFENVGDAIYMKLSDSRCKDLRCLQNSILSSLKYQKASGLIIGDYATRKCEDSIKLTRIA